jgi:parvulin-like peptidyl-prolyl isomerase
MNVTIVVNGEMAGPGVFDQELRRLSVTEPYLQQNEALEKAKKNVADQMLIRQFAVDKYPDIADSRIETRYKELIENFGGEESFFTQHRLSATDVPNIKKDLENQIRIELLVNDITKDIAPPPEHVVKEFYKRDRESTFKHEQVHAAHIVKEVDPKNPLKTYREMKKIRQELKNGADFAGTADVNSSCNDQGGDLGTFARGQMIEEFDVILFSMDEGEISPIFQTQFGYHIATVYEKFPENRLAYDECKDNLKQVVHGKLRDQCVDKWIDKARIKADIQVS